MEGWIKLQRKIEKHWIWKNPVYFKAWAYCLIRANYEENKVLIGTEIEVAEPGAFFTSIAKFSESTNLTPKQTRRFWSRLEGDLMVSLNRTHKRTKITVCNYEQYQVQGQSKGQTKGKRRANEGQTKGNGEEVKEVKEVKEEGGVPPPPLKKRSRDPDQKIVVSQFDIFWKIYPGKKAKKGACLSKWKTICGRGGKELPTWNEIRTAIREQSETAQWQKEMIPLPHTWLNQRRWLDDPAEMGEYSYKKKAGGKNRAISEGLNYNKPTRNLEDE